MAEWIARKEEKNKEEEGVKLEGQENESIEEVVEKADEGKLLLVRRVLISFQRIKEAPKDNSLPQKANTALIPTTSPHFKLP